MSSQNPGRQSPPPEKESEGQKSAPSSGQGVNPKTDNKEQSKKDLENLPSNPKPILEDHRIAIMEKHMPQKTQTKQEMSQ